MSKASLRQYILTKSVQRLLDKDETVISTVVMFTRHRLFLPYVLFSGVALFLVAWASGIASTFNQLAIAAAAVAVAGMATTNYSILAETTKGLVLLRSSRARQYAKELIRRLPAGTRLEMTGSTVITSDWKVDGVVYTMTKRWEAAMRQLATER